MCYRAGVCFLLNLYLCLGPAWGSPSDAGFNDDTCAFAQTNKMRRPPTRESQDSVKSLPGLSFKCMQFAGQVSVYGDVNPRTGDDEKAEMFYWFVGQGDGSDYDKQPTILWTNGGPGSTSLYGFWAENGPFELHNSSEGHMTLIPSPRSWTKRANYIIFDHPLSVGLSNGTSPDSALPRSAAQGVRQWYQALLNFLAIHPEIQRNPILLTGESYAGTYLPLLAKEIVDHKEQYPIDLRGMMLGDAWVDPWVQIGSDIEYAFFRGLISERQMLELRNVVRENISSNLSEIAGISMANIVGSGDSLDLQWELAMKYLNQEDVRKAINAHSDIPIVGFSSDRINKLYSSGLYDNVRPLVNDLLDKGVRTLVVSGLNDAKDCNFLGTLKWLNLLSGPEASSFRDAATVPWKPNDKDGKPGRVLGYLQDGGGKLSWVKVLNAGHMAVYDQPKLLDLLMEKFFGSS